MHKGVIANRYGVSLWGGENILKLLVAMVVWLREHMKIH